MKKLSIILSVLSIFLFYACSKKDEVSASKLKSGQSKVVLTASGAASGKFNSNDLISIVAKSSAEINISASYVNTSTFSTEIVMILLPATITEGTYNLKSMSSSDVLPVFTYTKGSTGWAAAPSEQEFTIEITKATSTEIEGTFSGKTVNETDLTEVNITNGKFAAKY